MPQQSPISRDDLVAVGAAIHVLQAGAFVEIASGPRRFAVVAVEHALSDDVLMARCRGTARFVHSDRLSDMAAMSKLLGVADISGFNWQNGLDEPVASIAVQLLKLAGFMPLGLLVPVGELATKPLMTVKGQAVATYLDEVAQSLEIASDAEVPLKEAEQARFVAFRSKLGGPQHYAIEIGRPGLDKAPLCRLHSECFTGDIFASMRCDCGEQLHGAIARMHEAGGGIMLYLSQEGRGIGLVNKLRAYRLQDAGVDTIDANTQLGFEPDERNFSCAARMLELLGTRRVRLMTNNPIKIAALSQHGIEVTGRVEHSFEANDHNHFYLETKARRGGHLLAVDQPGSGTHPPRP